MRYDTRQIWYYFHSYEKKGWAFKRKTHNNHKWDCVRKSELQQGSDFNWPHSSFSITLMFNKRLEADTGKDSGLGEIP